MEKINHATGSLAQQLKNALFQKKIEANPIPDQVVSEKPRDSTDAQGAMEQKYIERANQRRVEINTLKQEIASDKGYVNSVIKNKLAEFGIAENTAIQLNRDNFGHLSIAAPILPSQADTITNDLNKDPNFTDAFLRLTKTEPTLNYVDNVVKLNQAYGTKNEVFDSLLSEKKEFNQLKDISLRYESLRSAQGIQGVAPPSMKITIA